MLQILELFIIIMTLLEINCIDGWEILITNGVTILRKASMQEMYEDYIGKPIIEEGKITRYF